MEPQARSSDGRPCDACQTENVASARFCKQCGSSFLAPPSCPACRTDIPKEARFCPSCGLKLVGLRPIREHVVVAAPRAETQKSDAPPQENASDRVRAGTDIKTLTDNLPRVEPKGRSSNMLGNVL